MVCGTRDSVMTYGQRGSHNNEGHDRRTDSVSAAGGRRSRHVYLNLLHG